MILPFLLAAFSGPGGAMPPPDGPRAFVTRLYAAYRDPDYSPLRRPDRVFAPAFVAALKEDARLFRDEIGFIDADPICQCQDPGGMKAEVTAVARSGPAAAMVRVALRFGSADRRDVGLKLVRTPAGWRVADIASADEPSFLADLQAWNRRARARRH